MKKNLCWIVVTMVLVLPLAACDQSAAPIATHVFAPTELSIPTLPLEICTLEPAEGAPQSFEETISQAELVLLVEVVSAEPGPGYIGDPSSDYCLPTQHVTLQIAKVYKGASEPGQRLILYQESTGVADADHLQCVDDVEGLQLVFQICQHGPLYQTGERYVLGLVPVDLTEEVKRWQPKPWREGMVMTLPHGRLLVNQTGRITTVIPDGAGRAAPGDTVGESMAEIEAVIAAALRAGSVDSEAESTTAAADLNDTEWVLASLNGSDLVDDTNITLTFSQGFVGGFASCNGYGGRYSVAPGGILTISKVQRELQLCQTPEAIMQQEETFLGSLSNAAAYRLSDDRLEIVNTVDEIILVFAMKKELPTDTDAKRKTSRKE